VWGATFQSEGSGLEKSGFACRGISASVLLSSPESSDTQVYEPSIRARVGGDLPVGGLGLG